MSKLTHEEVNWGQAPEWETDMSVFHGDAEPVAELRAVSYVSHKGGDPEVYRHQFGTPEGRGHYLLKRKDGGAHKVSPPDDSEMIMGWRPIDFEDSNGDRIVTLAGLWLCTTDTGDHLYLASQGEAQYAIERRDDGPIVTAHGIEQ